MFLIQRIIEPLSCTYGERGKVYTMHIRSKNSVLQIRPNPVEVCGFKTNFSGNKIMRKVKNVNYSKAVIVLNTFLQINSEKNCFVSVKYNILLQHSFKV